MNDRPPLATIDCYRLTILGTASEGCCLRPENLGVFCFTARPAGRRDKTKHDGGLTWCQRFYESSRNCFLFGWKPHSSKVEAGKVKEKDMLLFVTSPLHTPCLYVEGCIILHTIFLSHRIAIAIAKFSMLNAQKDRESTFLM